jgi:hypothetical protein
MNTSRVDGFAILARRYWFATFLFAGVFGILISLSIEPLALGQDADTTADAREPDDSRSFAESLQQIDRDYIDFHNRRTRMLDSYSKVMKTLAESEQDLQRIGNEAIRQQMIAFQARLRSMQMDAMMAESRRNLSGSDNQGNPSNGSSGFQNVGLRALARDGIAQGKTAAELQFALSAGELQQLDAVGQAVIGRRLENFQQAGALQQEYRQWIVDWPKFMDRYWMYSDFERTWNLDQIQEAIKILNLANKDNYSAMLVSARLKCRVGMADDALELVERVIDADTALNSVAWAIKAEVLTASNKQGAAKSALQTALKLDRENVHVRWIRAEILADQKQYGTVETIWRNFLQSPEFELATRRRLAMLYFNRALNSKSKRSESDFLKAMKEAELGLELDAKPSWQANLIYAISLYGVGKNEEALEQISEACEKSTGESLQLCKEWEQRIKDGQTESWIYFRVLGSP